MGYNQRTNQYSLTFTVNKELHDHLKESYPKSKLSEFIRNCIIVEINKQKELPWNKIVVDKEKQD